MVGINDAPDVSTYGDKRGGSRQGPFGITSTRSIAGFSIFLLKAVRY